MITVVALLSETECPVIAEFAKSMEETSQVDYTNLFLFCHKASQTLYIVLFFFFIKINQISCMRSYKIKELWTAPGPFITKLHEVLFITKQPSQFYKSSFLSKSRQVGLLMFVLKNVRLVESVSVPDICTYKVAFVHVHVAFLNIDICI